MVYQRVPKSSSWNPPSQEKSSQFAPRPFAVQAQQNSHRPPTQQEIENETFNQNKFEAFGLQLKEKSGTITPIEQERLGVLQAKKNDFWAQRLERASRFGHNFADIPVHAPGQQVSAPVQPRLAIQPYRADVPLQSSQPAIASKLVEDRATQANGNTAADRPDSSVEQRPNKTGMPDALKAGVESLSGYSLDDVRVHYNSPKPAQLQALAYTQGTDIHVASGQEKHLPHEAWHVVQQAQGRVKPTMQMKDGVPVNDDDGLEHEADVMGAKAVQVASIDGSSTSNYAQVFGINETAPENNVVQRHTITQPGYATGDMFGIVAALIDDDNAHVVIKGGNGLVNDPTDKAISIKQFYLDSGIAEERVHLIFVDNVRSSGNAALRKEALNIEKTILGNTKSITKINKEDIKSVSGGTEYVAENFSNKLREKIKTAWDVNESKDAEIKTWLEEKGVPVKGSNVAVLWSRFSGKKGDIHLEHDSSYTGIEQIAIEAAQNYDAVIIAGDKGYKEEKGGKYDLITQRINSKLNAGKVFDLTEFWTEDSDTLRAWGGNTRFGQMKLYDFLHRNFQEAKHLGFRSGNLEAMAMLGYQVRYMEEPDSEGGDRMIAWHHHAQGRTKKGGLAAGYERLGVFEPPTRSGKYLKQHPDEDRRPEWAPGRQGATEKPKVSSLSKGFDKRDREAILEYLKPTSEKGTVSTLEPKTNTILQVPEILLAFANALTFMGLPLNFATLKDVDSTFRKLALKYHPDKEGGDKDKFVLLHQAKSILKGDLSSISGFNTKILAITQ